MRNHDRGFGEFMCHSAQHCPSQRPHLHMNLFRRIAFQKAHTKYMMKKIDKVGGEKKWKKNSKNKKSKYKRALRLPYPYSY